MTVDHASQEVLEIGEGLDVVELCTRFVPSASWLYRRKLGFGPRKIGFEVFEAELQLIIIKVRGASAELA